MILVAGLINSETSLAIDSFPIPYDPVRYPFFGVNSNLGGVGINIALALHALAVPVRLLSIVGKDAAAEQAHQTLSATGIDTTFIRNDLEQTCQSVILYDPSGRRAIYTDLKDIQERSYPIAEFERAAVGCSLAVLCNIQFARPLLSRARALNLPIATDVHALGDLDDAYNYDYIAAADILFLSHERLSCAPEEMAGRIQERFQTPVVVIGLGADGALLADRTHGVFQRVPARNPRPVVNTVGAGDALFSAFIASYSAGLPPLAALERAVLFAGYKIGESGATRGFLSASELDALL